MEGDASSASSAATSELNDWEVLVNSDSEDGRTESKSFEEIGAESEGMIRLNYFSIDNDVKMNAVGVGVDVSSVGSVESENPSWVDPVYRVSVNSGEYWSDSVSDRSEDGKGSVFEGKSELGFVGDEKSEVGYEGIGEGRGFWLFDARKGVEGELGFEGIGETRSEDEGLVKFLYDSGGNGSVVSQVSDDVSVGSKMLSGSDDVNALKEEGLDVVAIEEKKSGGEVEKKKLAWWKVPFEVLRYCVFKVSPLWTFSMAAAVMGFVILGRRLYKMKHKARSLQLKVAVEDKKASQVMSRAARLNEAFSMVRRVPMVRLVVPATGVNPWPMMILR